MADTYKRFRSPIQYVGGKYWLVEHIWDFLPEGLTEMMSPFFGAGTVEINIAYHKGVKVYAYDICEFVMNFWKHWMQSPSQIIRDAKRLCMESNQEDLRKLKKRVIKDGKIRDPYGMAVYFYVFNRLSFQGITHCDFIDKYRNEDGTLYKSEKSKVFLYDDWEYAKNIHLEIKACEFQKSLTEHTDVFAYLDPPFFSTEQVFGKGKQIFNHHELSEILKSRDNWILSSGHYPQVPYIKLAYKGYTMLEYSRTSGFHYNTGAKTEWTQLLIFSHDLAEKAIRKRQENGVNKD